ncbi:MAG: acetyl-CoA carboxylase biotin carboxyl carrier protein [Candidatus Gastranaerophilales bacterium]|nr:acetyl-CoA carboxylase biotin carboxyl carrier protein [Candidatus Gastranaerophilales bacterium]
MGFELEYLNKLAEIVHKNNLSELTLEGEEMAISIKREKPQIIEPETLHVMPSSITSQVISSNIQKSSEQKNETQHKGKPITSPMVGTFYASPSPDEPPFVKTGDNISIGQVICIIEAMKLMNEIEADVSGKITEICVNNGDSIEFGQVLMYVD